MENKVRLIIELPNKVLAEVAAESIIIPAKKGDVTILSERAPSVFATDFGQVQLLDGAARTTERYFVAAGVADTAQGLIRLMTPMAVAAKDISVDEALKRASDETDEAKKMFYRMIADKLENKTGNYKY
ncbi:MAG: hypothetical protein PUH03_00705 [bacterium]|nr:hypothetical protein [bacterium]MDY2830223.1 hypothetical protein [Alphaproteobacteria bacterium]